MNTHSDIMFSTSFTVEPPTLASYNEVRLLHKKRHMRNAGSTVSAFYGGELERAGVEYAARCARDYVGNESLIREVIVRHGVMMMIEMVMWL